jgi:hypothetical protein
MTQAAQLAQYGANNVGLSFKNRIINGDMTIDQRNNGAAVNNITGAGFFITDRWKSMAVNSWAASGVVFSGQQNRDSLTPPAGFTNYLGIATTTQSTSLPATATLDLTQVIEGFNVADLGWGTANAQPVTLSFWARSNLTGTFGGSLINSAYNRVYVFSYTISAANTWEYKTVTITGDTSGTWLTTNGIGITVSFSLGAGSSMMTTPGSWGSTLVSAPTGQQQICASTSNRFYITGVQLEKGTVATSFDYLPYTTELQLCQRYYFQTIADANGVTSPFSSVIRATLNTASLTQNFPVAMRTLPSITFVAGSGVLIFGASNESRSLTGAPSTITGSANAPYNFVAFYQNATSITGGTPYCAYIYPGAGYTYSSEL